MKYPQIVAMARFEAQQSGKPQIVYESRPKGKVSYGYSTQREFNETLALGKFPIIRLLMCMPDGTVIQ